MRLFAALSVLAIPLLVPLAAESARSAPAANIVIKDNYFKYNNYRYYRNRAEDVEFVSFGDKRTPAVGNHYLNIQGRITARRIQQHGRLKTASSGTINWSTYKQTDVEASAGLNYFAYGGSVAVPVKYKQLTTGHIVLLKIYMDDNPLIRVINKSPTALRTLDDEGSDGRIVDAIWVIMEAELATYFQNTTSFSISANAAALSIQAQGTGAKSGWQTVVLTPGTTFAYDLNKVKKWGPHHDSIESLKDDPQN